MERHEQQGLTPCPFLSVSLSPELIFWCHSMKTTCHLSFADPLIFSAVDPKESLYNFLLFNVRGILHASGGWL
jgi:hypothetical protein